MWDELVAWCTVPKKHEPPASPLGKADRYFTNHQVALARFLDYGYLPLDNGIVERLHVRALTRKNFLFAPTREAIARRSHTRSSDHADSPVWIRSSTSPTSCRASLAASASSTCRHYCLPAGPPHVRQRTTRSACHDHPGAIKWAIPLRSTGRSLVR